MTKEKIKDSTIEEIVQELKSENGIKKTKTPRQYDSILKGALALPLLDRDKLKRALFESIMTEIEDKKKDYEEAAKIGKE